MAASFAGLFAEVGLKRYASKSDLKISVSRGQDGRASAEAYIYSRCAEEELSVPAGFLFKCRRHHFRRYQLRDFSRAIAFAASRVMPHFADDFADACLIREVRGDFDIARRMIAENVTLIFDAPARGGAELIFTMRLFYEHAACCRLAAHAAMKTIDLYRCDGR